MLHIIIPYKLMINDCIFGNIVFGEMQSFMVYLNGGLRPPDTIHFRFLFFSTSFQKHISRGYYFAKRRHVEYANLYGVFKWRPSAAGFKHTFVFCSSRHLFKNTFREAIILQNVDMSNMQIYMAYLNGGLRPPDTKHFHYCS